MIRLISFYCFFFVLFTSCEDKKTSGEKIPSRSNEAENQKSQEPDTLTTISSEEKQEEKNQETKTRPPGPLIVQEELIPFLTQYGKDHPEDKIRIKTRFGNIDVQLFRDTPLHRANMIFLINQNYFDNTFFHRVSPRFVIQGGNSDNPSTNKKRHYIGDYLIPNEYEAGHRHVRGAFSAAKYSERNVSDASSPYEFFIVQSKNGAHHLDNEYTVYGKVIDGMEIVDKISQVETGAAEWPMTNIYIDLEIID